MIFNMKKIFICITLFIFLSSIVSAQVIITSQDEQRAKNIVNKMTLKEKIDYISGYTTWSIRPIPRLGLPEIIMSDGPQGIRCWGKSTMYPCGILSASTWNRELNYKLGQGIGQDARARGVHILLGPGVNIYRAPMCGRNFEYFGEDPYLASEVAKNYILGVQSKNVIATIKHFAANNQEWDRYDTSSDVDERTLQEIYLATFRKAVQEAHVGAVMNSYNLLNSVHTTESKWLDTDILRTQWGFKGILMSDWSSVHSGIAAANAGLDLEMPNGEFMNEKNLMPAIRNGIISEATIDLKVQHILQTLIAFGFLDNKQKDTSIPLDNPSSKQIALNVAREGIVLLKNQDNILPLKGTVAIIGPNTNRVPRGGGSGDVEPFSSISLFQGLKNLIGNKVTELSLYDDVYDTFYADKVGGLKGFKTEYYKNRELAGEPDYTCIEKEIDHDWKVNSPLKDFPVDSFSVRWTSTYIPKISGQLRLFIGGDDGYRLIVNGKELMSDWTIHAYTRNSMMLNVEAGKEYKFQIEYFENLSSARILFQAGMLNQAKLNARLAKIDNIVMSLGFDSDIEGEGADRPFALDKEQELLIDNITRLNKNVVVIINSGGGIDFSRWEKKVKGIMMAWYPGEDGGQAISELLIGKYSPSGKLPISIEQNWNDNPTYESYYDNIGDHYKRVNYKEGIFMGYRGYDHLNRIPLYPFGFGLSYTTFAYSNLSLEKTDKNTVKVNFDIRNTGKCNGYEIAEIYVHDIKSSVPRPAKELKGFEKVFLKKGEIKHVSLELHDDAFSFYDINKHQFMIEKGEFEILVGPASNQFPLKGVINM